MSERPMCCGGPMRETGMGAGNGLPAYLCEGCERYEQRGIRTDGPWWRTVDGRADWNNVHEQASSTIVSHRCARCNATLDEASVEGHEERCFVVPPLRYSHQISVGGLVLMRDDTMRLKLTCQFGEVMASLDCGAQRFGDVEVRLFVYGTVGGRIDAIMVEVTSLWRDAYWSASVVHVLPEQPTLSARLGHLKHGPGGSGLSGPCDADCKKCEVERNTTRAGRIEAIVELAYDGKITGEQAKELLSSPDLNPPAPTLYDGLTAERCYAQWYLNRAYVEKGAPIVYAMTSDQIAEAKRIHGVALQNGWSVDLRARIAAAREQERVIVQLPVDAEDIEW